MWTEQQPGSAREGQCQGLAWPQPLCLHSYRVGGALEEDAGCGPGPVRLLRGADGAGRTRLWHPKLEAFPDSGHCTCLAALLLLLVRRYFPEASHPPGTSLAEVWLECNTDIRLTEHSDSKGCGLRCALEQLGQPLGQRGAPRSQPFPTCRALPESARWLLTRGRVEEAKQVIQKAASVNKRKLSPELLSQVLGTD